MTLKGAIENKHWLVKVITWVSITLVLTLFAMFIWSLLPGRGTVDNLKWLQFLQTTATFLLPPLCLAYLCSSTPLSYLRLGPSRGTKGATSLVAIVTILIAIPGINLLSYLNQQVTLPAFLEPLEALMKQQEDTAAALTESFLQTRSISGLIINILLMALLPALSEELTFRGLLVRTRTAVWVAAIIFSAIHFQFYGFVPRMLLGVLFGYVLLWSGSLWIPVLMHFTNNCVAVLLYYIAYTRERDIDNLETIGTGNTLWLGIASILLSGVFIYLLHHILTKSYDKSLA